MQRVNTQTQVPTNPQNAGSVLHGVSEIPTRHSREDDRTRATGPERPDQSDRMRATGRGGHEAWHPSRGARGRPSTSASNDREQHVDQQTNDAGGNGQQPNGTVDGIFHGGEEGGGCREERHRKYTNSEQVFRTSPRKVVKIFMAWGDQAGWREEAGRVDREKRKMEPSPGVLSTCSVRSWAPRMCFTMARPSPVPPWCRDRLLSTR